jgi:hypothetical protein
MPAQDRQLRSLPVTGFTELFRAQASSAWRATKTWPLKYANWLDKLGQWLGERGPQSNLLGYTGFFSALLLPIIGSLISMLVVLAGECFIVGYALLTSALWGVGAVVEIGPRALRRTVRRVRR